LPLSRNGKSGDFVGRHNAAPYGTGRIDARRVPTPHPIFLETIMAMIQSETRRQVLLALGALALGGCATPAQKQADALSDAEKLVAEAQSTLSDFMRDPDQTWIQNNLGRARGLLVAPQIVRAGFIFGGSGGRAVLLGRERGAWNGPAFYDLATASVGFQAGVDVSQVIVVVMTEKAMNALMSNSFKIGADASIAAGPVGAGAGSTVTADLVAFTRAKGVYGGVNLDGTVIHPSESLNTAYYGRNVTATDVLIRGNPKSPRANALITDVTRATR
jgi:lipid-binding SYLF domain-containing protein